MSDEITQDIDFAQNINYNPNDNAQIVEINQNNNQIEDNYKEISNNIDQQQKSINKDYYISLNINDIYQDYDKLKKSNIGPLIPFKFYIKLEFCCEKDYKKLLDLSISDIEIFYFRNIKGDGNCFYRSFIFSYIENIILTNNINLMKELFIKFNSFYEIGLSNDYKINFEEIKIIFSIIIDFMQTNNDNLTAFKFFQNAYLFSETFDKGIIFFMKYLIKEYLSLNQNEYYNNNTDIPIGSLLPPEYIKGDTYLFDEYYRDDLMKMNTDAKGIAVRVSPYALNCELNIFRLKYELNGKTKKIFCDKESYNPNNDEANFIRINLIYSPEKMHYDLAYTKSFYEEYENYLMDFTKSIYSIIINQELSINQINKLYIEYLDKKSSTKFSGTFLEYINSDVKNISEILKIDKEKKEEIEEKIKDIIKEEKNKICIKCYNKNFKEAYFEFLCGCKICKEECFKKYIEPDEDDENKIYYDYFTKCPCGEEFSKKKVEEYLDQHKNKDKEKYDLLMQAHWKWRCMVCNDTFNRRFRYYRLIFKEKCEFTKQNLEHLICFNCKKEKDIKEKNEIECTFCGNSHKIKSIRYVDEDNKNEPVCLII